MPLDLSSYSNEQLLQAAMHVIYKRLGDAEKRKAPSGSAEAEAEAKAKKQRRRQMLNPEDMLRFRVMPENVIMYIARILLLQTDDGLVQVENLARAQDRLRAILFEKGERSSEAFWRAAIQDTWKVPASRAAEIVAEYKGRPRAIQPPAVIYAFEEPWYRVYAFYARFMPTLNSSVRVHMMDPRVPVLVLFLPRSGADADEYLADLRLLEAGEETFNPFVRELDMQTILSTPETSEPLYRGLLEKLKGNTTLKRVSISDQSRTRLDIFVAQLLNQNPLEELHLNRFQRSEPEFKVESGLPPVANSTLRRLELLHVEVDDLTVFHGLWGKLTGLREVLYTGDNVAVARQFLGAPLASLELNDCLLTGVGVDGAAGALAANGRLERLRLHRTASSTEGWGLMLDGLSGNQSLREVDVSSPAYTQDSPNFMSELLALNYKLVNAFRNKPALRSLKLTGAELSDDQGVALALSLGKNNRQLESLDLSTNKIGSLGAISLIVAAEGMARLASLDLAANEIGADAEPQLIAFFGRADTALRYINVAYNRLSEDNEQLAALDQMDPGKRVVVEPQRWVLRSTQARR